MLIENAIKHNVISAQKPLRIGLTCKDGYLIVSNNLQPKLTAAESNGIGLNNIMERYKFLTNKEVIIRKTEDNFEVRVPIL
jgi:sensor histidine kinase YesM